jgi:transcriptional regulator GlxA family with amidase domain
VAVLLETRRLVVGEVDEDVAAAWPRVVFPLAPLRVGAVLLATANHAVVATRPLAGDRCVVVAVRPDELPGARAALAPSAAGLYLAQHLLVRGLRERRLADGEAEALALGLARRCVARVRAVGRRGRPTTREAHRRLAETAKAELWRARAEPLTLPALAERLRCSPFHLARVFRAETGYSVDAYDRTLRLRLALERLPSSRGRLSAVALESGFSSHSHFSEAFRREFGLPPSALC